jgi:hypothetical protein
MNKNSHQPDKMISLSGDMTVKHPQNKNYLCLYFVPKTQCIIIKGNVVSSISPNKVNEIANIIGSSNNTCHNLLVDMLLLLENGNKKAVKLNKVSVTKDGKLKMICSIGEYKAIGQVAKNVISGLSSNMYENVELIIPHAHRAD